MPQIAEVVESLKKDGWETTEAGVRIEKVRSTCVQCGQQVQNENMLRAKLKTFSVYLCANRGTCRERVLVKDRQAVLHEGSRVQRVEAVVVLE